jgi:nitroreductase
MANEVFEAVRTVMAVRQYQDKALPDEVVRRIVEAGRLSASGSNVQPWHFVVVRDRALLRKLGSLVRTAPYIANAAAAVVVAYEKEKGQIGLADATRAIQSMILASWGDGVASNWTGFSSLEPVRTEVGLPDKYQVIAVLTLGYPAQRVIGKKRRKPFDEVVSAERFGNPLT